MNRISAVGPTISVVVLFFWGTMSGCVTTLGYVPEHLKPSDEKTYTPTYTEVKKWAFDVADGYDSRATINKHAIYGGALIAAGAVSAMAGLAAFGTGTDAIKAIPIGAGFLASVAAIYSNERKAEIYGLGSQYIKDLIILSDERLLKQKDLTNSTSTHLINAKNSRDEAKLHMDELRKDSKAIENEWAQAVNDFTGESDSAKKEKLDVEVANKKKLLDDITRELKKAELHLERTDLLRELARDRHSVWKNKKVANKRFRFATPGGAGYDEIKRKSEAADLNWDQIIQNLEKKNLKEKEAICLRKDVNKMMREVRKQEDLLIPQNVVSRLRDVGAKNLSAKEINEILSPDLRDLRPPVTSVCSEK